MDLVTNLAYTTEALALKSNLLYSDLPKFPHNIMIHFNPPFVHRPVFHCLGYNVGVGPPPSKTIALQLLHEAAEFAQQLDPYARGIYRDSVILLRFLLLVDELRGLGRTPVWAPSEAVIAVISTWSDESEREGELEQWVAATARIVGRLQQVVDGADTPVVMIGAARWRGGAYASGVEDCGALVRRLVGSVVARWP